MLIDEVDVIIRAGHGGAGKVSFSGPAPDGGSGGCGGSVYVTTTSDLMALNVYSANNVIEAENGQPGASKGLTGRNGKDVEFVVPIGTTLINKATGESRELNEVGVRLQICKGGIGGRGNLELKNSRNIAPKKAQGGRLGDVKELHLSLRFLADFGLVGLPNAGKSSLLNVLTNAKAKVGAYPFTTLEANLGVLNGKIIADIPGLIEGAADGKGLGIQFLKHIKKVSLIIHCLSAESLDLKKDFSIINNELIRYGAGLHLKPRIILLTKTDLINKVDKIKKVNELKKYKYLVHSVSIYDLDSVETLKNKILNN